MGTGYRFEYQSLIVEVIVDLKVEIFLEFLFFLKKKKLR